MLHSEEPSLNPEDIQKAMPYLKLAWELAKKNVSEKTQMESGTPEEAIAFRDSKHLGAHASMKRFSGLEPSIQEAILKTVAVFEANDLLQKAVAEEENLDADRLDTDLLESALDNNNFESLLKDNPESLLLGLSSIVDVIDIFKGKATASERYRKIGDRFLDIADLVHRSSPLTDKIPPLKWSLILASSIPAAIGAWAKYQEAKKNPDFTARHMMKSESAFTIVAAIASIIAVPIILAATGPVAAAAAGCLLSVYGLVLGFRSLTKLVKSVHELIVEIRDHKEPAATYKARVLKKALECVKHTADLVFYVTASLVSITGVVALFANPISLGALAGSMGLISMVTMGAIAVSMVAQKLADRKIKNTEALLNELENELNNSPLADHPHAKRFKTIHAGFKKVQKLSDQLRGIHEDYRTHGHQNPALFLAKQAEKHQGLMFKAMRHLGLSEYAQTAESTFDMLAKVKQSPIYKDIHYVKQTIHEDPLGLLVKIPKWVEGGDQVLPDQIRRFKNHHGRIQINMNADPSDKALCLMMQLNQGLAPLKMKACGDAEMVLKVLEAAKLADVGLKIDPSDLALFDQAEPKTQAYFEALREIPARKFQGYVEEQIKKHGDRLLGEVPETLPQSWKTQLKINQSNNP